MRLTISDIAKKTGYAKSTVSAALNNKPGVKPKTREEIQPVNNQIDEQKKKAVETLQQKIKESVDTFIETAGQTVVETVETEAREQKKRTIEDNIRDHLRGFSRTIPSFLMAYGDENTTLESFDQIIPDEVFQAVTSISLEQFRLLRDGGQVLNPETEKPEDYYGHLFDPVVFNDSIKEFLAKKVELADYFDKKNQEDIFDYVPPQKTNQIFTPKWVVKDMVDRLEKENPGCFDDPDKTFADLYMKSGMYRLGKDVGDNFSIEGNSKTYFAIIDKDNIIITNGFLEDGMLSVDKAFIEDSAMQGEVAKYVYINNGILIRE